MSTQPSFDGGVGDIDLTAAEYVLGVLDAMHVAWPANASNANRLSPRKSRAGNPGSALAAVDRAGRAAGIDLAAAARRAVATRTSRTRPANCADGAAIAVEKARVLARGGSRRIRRRGGQHHRVVADGAPAPVAPPIPAGTRRRWHAPPAAAPMVVSLRHDDGTTAYTATVDPRAERSSSCRYDSKAIQRCRLSSGSSRRAASRIRWG